VPSFPPRLHVLLARDAPRGVVLRRGPSGQVCAIGWDRDRDRFTVGQWLRGRIYERRSDLSPDGVHLIYFAMNGHWKGRARGSWTAISRAPWLTALTLYAKGDCWNGGGLFLSSREYWLNDGYGHERLEDASGLRRQDTRPWPGSYGGECPGVYYLRLQRDGWRFRPELTRSSRSSTVDVFERDLRGGWILRKYADGTVGPPPGRGVYGECHVLEHGERRIVEDHPDWEWADLERARLVWAAAGKLWTGTPGKDGLRDARVLHDFDGMTFERLEAPYPRPAPVVRAALTETPAPEPPARPRKAARKRRASKGRRGSK